MSVKAVSVRQKRGAAIEAKNRRARVQWLGLALVAVLLVVAFFVFFDSSGATPHLN